MANPHLSTNIVVAGGSGKNSWSFAFKTIA